MTREPSAPAQRDDTASRADEYSSAVLDLVAQIPEGRVMTYGLIAEIVAESLHRGGPRYVGRVLSRGTGDDVTMDWAEEVAWGLNQADHRAAGISVLDALRDADNPWVFRDLLDHPEPRAMLEEFTFDDDATARTGPPVHAVDFRVYPM